MSPTVQISEDWGEITKIYGALFKSTHSLTGDAVSALFVDKQRLTVSVTVGVL